MPSNFNGIEITDANFNGTALDLIYMNGVEVFSAVTQEYLLRLDPVNQDAVTLADDYNIPSGSDWYFSIKINTTDLTKVGGQTLFSRIGVPNALESYFMRVFSTGFLEFRFGGASANRIRYETDITVEYPNQEIEIKFRYNPNNDKEIFINDVLKASVNSAIYPSDSFIANTQVGGFNLVSNFYDGRVISFDVNGEVWNLNEGTGFTVLSTPSNLVGTGVTANAGGLTYWNSTVWELIP